MNLKRVKGDLKTNLKTRLSFLRSKNVINYNGQKQLEMLLYVLDNPKCLEQLSVGKIKDYINSFCEKYYSEQSPIGCKGSKEFFDELNEFGIKQYDPLYTIFTSSTCENVNEIRNILIEKNTIASYNFPTKQDVVLKYQELVSGNTTQEEYNQTCTDAGYYIQNGMLVLFSIEQEYWNKIWSEMQEKNIKKVKVI